ncbi:hypothetical protein [Paraburkholderia sp. BL10I2N1]|uniref:hypothetical protein n=1 Tax=unclassified Paraburkholderia TaxID=2615204 RepID=UPI00103F2FF5|nr:hypothetical protein [Paraburkholderia sp. BL10I2N1]TCG02333.1 hypothetical protein BZM26_00260 [Paraburkholderia strydomiana]TDN62400.1 hypothetical protein B0G77_5967 [Paraburkholderia sp. BL10I2N1]
MTHDTTPDSRRLPEGFEDLDQFLDRWSTPTSHERWICRSTTPYPEVLRFYEAMFARAEEATVYLERFPLDDMPEPAVNLFRLLLAMCHAGVSVEIHQSPAVRHAPPKHALQILTGFQPHG